MVATGRYSETRHATLPGELPPAGRVNANCHIAHGTVADPNPALRGKRQRVAINIKTDALELEYARGRISEAAYQSALTYARVLELSRPPAPACSWAQGDRVDQSKAHEDVIAKRIDRARGAVDMIRDTAPVLGMIAQRVLELVLVDRLTLAQAAERVTGRCDRLSVSYTSQMFRTSCELLADHWCSRSRAAPRVA